MTKIYGTACCGVGQIDGISEQDTPEQVMWELRRNLKYLFDYTPLAYLTFVGVVKLADQIDDVGLAHARSDRTDNYGQAFADYIKENDLGDVYPSAPKVSWSKNTLQMWVWAPDWQKLMSHVDRMEVEVWLRAE